MGLEQDLQIAVCAHVHQLPEIQGCRPCRRRVRKPPLQYELPVHVLAWKLSLSTRANELHAAGVDCPVPMDSGVRGADDTQVLVVVTIEQVEHKRIFVFVASRSICHRRSD